MKKRKKTKNEKRKIKTKAQQGISCIASYWLTWESSRELSNP